MFCGVLTMHKITGFTLIEVLIALVILTGGLLGLAAFQASSIKNNQSAYNRSQATQLAYDIADRMRANTADASRIAASTYITFAPSAAASQPSCKTAPGCIAALMAQNDLFEWYAVLSTTLPGCNTAECGSITVNGALFTVTINWDDNRDGIIDNNDPSFTTSFSI